LPLFPPPLPFSRHGRTAFRPPIVPYSRPEKPSRTSENVLPSPVAGCHYQNAAFPRRTSGSQTESWKKIARFGSSCAGFPHRSTKPSPSLRPDSLAASRPADGNDYSLRTKACTRQPLRSRTSPKVPRKAARSPSLRTIASRRSPRSSRW
jgi:hypothetical protein